MLGVKLGCHDVQCQEREETKTEQKGTREVIIFHFEQVEAEEDTQ